MARQKTAVVGAAAAVLMVALALQRWAMHDAPAGGAADQAAPAATAAPGGEMSTQARIPPSGAHPPPRFLAGVADGAASATILGLVVDQQGRTVPEATLRVLALDSFQELAPPVVTRSDGRFELRSLALGTMRLYGHSGRHRPSWVGPISLDAAGERREVTVVLRAGRAISGRVVDDTGAPVAGARVGASDEGPALATTGEDGAFALHGLGDAPVNVFAIAAGFAPRHKPRVAAGSSGVLLTLERPASVSGHLDASLTRPRSLRVRVCHHDERVGRELCVASRIYDPAEPSFSVGGLPSGKYQVLLEADDGRAARISVTLAPGQTLALDDVRLAH